VLFGRGLFDELVTRPEESYRLCCVVVCDLETSWMRRPWPTGGLMRQLKQYMYTCCSFRLCVRACVHTRAGSHVTNISCSCDEMIGSNWM
jgi:hypothetical protein